MITTPGSQTTGKTLYDNYGMAGQYWASTGLTCSQMTSLIGNNVAGMVFDMAKSLDRVTITVYQSAAGSNILAWLSGSVDKLITALGNAIYFPFLAPDGDHRRDLAGLAGPGPQAGHPDLRGHDLDGRRLRRRDLADRPAQRLHQRRHHRLQRRHLGAEHGVRQAARHRRQQLPARHGGRPAVRHRELLVHLGQRPGGPERERAVVGARLQAVAGRRVRHHPVRARRARPAATDQLVNLYGRQLLWAQAVATNEQPVTAATSSTPSRRPTTASRTQLQQTNPAVYSLFQGDQWTTRLEIGFEALFAAVAAGLLVLLIALTLIMLKLGFLLLLVAGPFFLIIGIHPGFGRVIAIRWFEMLVGVLLKQVAVALTLSVLLYCYSLIMGTTDQVLPWALKIMMIALVTVAVFIYRKPFQHLFSSVGYGMLGADERAQVSWRESTFGFRRVTAGAAGVVVPGIGAPARVPLGAARRADTGGGADGTARGRAAGSRRPAPPSPRGWPARPPRTATSPRGSGRTRGSAPAAGRRRRCRCRRTGGPPVQRPLGGLGPQRRRRDGHRGARGPAQPPVRQTGRSRRPGQRGAGGPPGPARAAAAPDDRKRVAGGSSRPRSGSSNGAAGGAGKPPAAPFWSRSRRRSK